MNFSCGQERIRRRRAPIEGQVTVTRVQWYVDTVENMQHEDSDSDKHSLCDRDLRAALELPLSVRLADTYIY